MGVLRFLARAVDSCQGHINNLYNTTFWALVQKGDMGTTEAEEALKVLRPVSLLRGICATIIQGTVASQKNEMLFSRFGINYNDEPEQFKKGSVLFRDVRWLSHHREEM